MKGPWLFAAACTAVGVGFPVLVWWYSPPSDARKVVAICRDGSRTIQRADGSHYARVGFDRVDVPNPETVCK